MIVRRTAKAHLHHGHLPTKRLGLASISREGADGVRSSTRARERVMTSHPTMELDRRFSPGQASDEVTTASVERLIKLSSWMMVLGTVRLVCMLADNANAFADAARIEPLSMRTFARMAEEIHPVVAISSAWPLVLAIAVRRARWPQLLPAAAATFFVLSIGGMLELWLQWGHAQGYGGMVGSFHLTRRAFLRPNASDLALGSLGAIQLTLELATAIRAILIIPGFRGEPHDANTKAVRARRARCGRMALYTSIGYLFVVIRLPVWSTYLEVLNNSTLVRNFILKSDTEQFGGRRYSPPLGREPTAEEKRLAEIGQTVAAAINDVQSGRFSEARDRYRESIESIDSLADDGALETRRQVLVATALNNLAWLEATCSDAGFRDGAARAPSNRAATRRGELLEHARRGPLPRRRVGGRKSRPHPLDVAPQKRRQFRLVFPGDGRAQAGKAGRSPPMVRPGGRVVPSIVTVQRGTVPVPGRGR
jgi:hypothetical protein